MMTHTVAQRNPNPARYPLRSHARYDDALTSARAMAARLGEPVAVYRDDYVDVWTDGCTWHRGYSCTTAAGLAAQGIDAARVVGWCRPAPAALERVG